jgi:hypothetical protein
MFKMIKSIKRLLLPLFLMLFCLAGCETKPPAPKFNACLSSPYDFYSIKSALKPDTYIVVQCRRIQQYDLQTKGDCNAYWYLTDWKVINVEKGKWSDPNLTFVIADNCPSPQSGIMLKKMIWPYTKGCIFCFGLDTSQKNPLIVCQESRSRIAPDFPIQGPKAMNNDTCEKVFKKVNNFTRKEKTGLVNLQITEEFDTFFIVSGICPDGSEKFVLVDKDSYLVNWIPEFF